MGSLDIAMARTKGLALIEEMGETMSDLSSQEHKIAELQREIQTFRESNIELRELLKEERERSETLDERIDHLKERLHIVEESKDDIELYLEKARDRIDRLLTIKKEIATLTDLQSAIGEWSDVNFPLKGGGPLALKVQRLEKILSLVEELGEFAHAILKIYQSIRGSEDKHLAEAKDSLADLVIYLLDFCHKIGWNFSEILYDTWKQVRERDWIKYPEGGCPDCDVCGTPHKETVEEWAMSNSENETCTGCGLDMAQYREPMEEQLNEGDEFCLQCGFPELSKMESWYGDNQEPNGECNCERCGRDIKAVIMSRLDP